MLHCAKPESTAGVRAGHPWIYNSEIEKVEGDLTPGDVAEVHNFRGGYIGRGFYNPNSVISLRMLTTKDEVCDREFFKKRIQDAWNYRRALCDPGSCRLIYSESDFLPGLVVDKFGECLRACRFSPWASNAFGTCWWSCWWKSWPPRALCERRRRARAPSRRGWNFARAFCGARCRPGWTCGKTGLLFGVDLISGQKTGFFLDQKQNRAGIAPFCRDARVLDCFCHNGSFSLHAAKYGAKSVLGVDISEDALEVAREKRPAQRSGKRDLRSPQLLRSPARPVRCGRKVRPGNSGSPRLYQVRKTPCPRRCVDIRKSTSGA